MDLHAAQIQGFFDIPVDNLLRQSRSSSNIICPSSSNLRHDDGRRLPGRRLRRPQPARLPHKMHMGLAIVDKRRQKANQCEVMNIIGDVEGKTCILFDDMVDTAGSLCNAAKAIVEIGGAKEVYACATHGVLSGPANERIANSCIKELTFLNTIPPPAGVRWQRRSSYLDVSPIFAEAIHANLRRRRPSPSCSDVMLFQKPTCDWLIVGLGNPGPELCSRPGTMPASCRLDLLAARRAGQGFQGALQGPHRAGGLRRPAGCCS